MDVSKGHGEDARTYLGAGDARRNIEETDGLVDHVEASTGPRDVLNIRADAVIPANALEDVRLPQKKEKPPDLPSQSARTPPDECGNHADALSISTDGHSIETNTQTAENRTETIRMC